MKLWAENPQNFGRKAGCMFIKWWNNQLAINAQGDNEPLKAARIMERIKYLSREIEMEGKNLRDKG